MLKRLLPTIKQAIQHEGGFFKLITKCTKVLSTEGFNGILFRLNHLHIIARSPLLIQQAPQSQPENGYLQWLAQNEVPINVDNPLALLATKPKISILCPLYNPNPQDLIAAIDSVTSQTYENWELCFADDASPQFDAKAFFATILDPRIKWMQRQSNGNISVATNSALELASGEYIGFLDQDDLLAKDTLLWVAAEINQYPSACLIYTDEDKLNREGVRCDPHCKPDWNYQYFLSCNYLCHFTVYAKKLLNMLAGCRKGFEGVQDYDLGLRAIEKITPNQIRHIPRLLYHWRKHPGSTSEDALAKPYVIKAGEQAIREHLARTKQRATVSTEFIRYRVKYAMPPKPPLVSIVIPTRDGLDLLQPCIKSIQAHTHYPNYEIVVINNNSTSAEILKYLDHLQKQKNIRVIDDGRPFNFAALMNHAIGLLNSELVCLLNNDIEIISKQWLDEMVSLISQSKVGIVGAKLHYSDDTIQHGGVILGIGGVAGHAHKYFPSKASGYIDRLKVRQELSAVTGACMLTKRSVYGEVGGMDDKALTIAFNDIDYCLKVRELGYKIIWTPFAELYHHESKSRGSEDSPEKMARFNQESEVMQKRWQDKLYSDPAYNPNLSLVYEDFRLAEPTRAKPFSLVCGH